MNSQLSDHKRLQALIQQADAAEKRYFQDEGIEALDEAIALWERILNHPDFAAEKENLRMRVLNGSAASYLHRYQMPEDSDRALSYWKELETTHENSLELSHYLT